MYYFPKTDIDKNYLTHRKRVSRKYDRLDKEIDQLVYQPACAKPLRQGRLYGLTEEEIKIVEKV
jgi:hypothetical protein